MAAEFPTAATRYADTANLDAFSRLRVSDPVTIWDSTFVYDLQPNLFTTAVTNGTVAHSPNNSSAQLSVTANTGASAVIMSKGYVRYQPGHSQLVLMTSIFGAATANIVKRQGYFDALDGIFLEQNGTTDVAFVRRTSTSGSAVDNRVVQASWSIDPMNGSGPSGVTLDLSKCQIVVVDLQWLGMGRVRVGFDVGGIIYYCHEFMCANVLTVPYMKQASLPVRWEIRNLSNTSIGSMLATCSSVLSEGGFQTERGSGFATINTADISVTTAKTHLVSIRMGTTFNGVSTRGIMVMIRDYQILSGTNALLIEVIYGGTITGGSWVAVTGAACESNITATWSTGGSTLASFFVGSSGAGTRTSSNAVAPFSFPISVDPLTGAQPILSLVATSVNATSLSRGAINWVEFR